jgi:capsular polysaccharide biosynthesis protein
MYADRYVFIYLVVIIAVIILGFLSQFVFEPDNKYEQRVEKLMRDECDIDIDFSP